MKKIICLLVTLLCVFALPSCKNNNKQVTTLATPQNVKVSDTGLITWDKVENATGYVVKINGNETAVKTNSYQVENTKQDFVVSVYAKAEGYTSSAVSEEVKFTAIKLPEPPLEKVTVGIKGSSEVKSGKSINLEAIVSGSTDKTVTWRIKKGSEFATIDQSGKLTAKSVDGDKVIEITATSNANKTVRATKIITIVTKPVLTQEMLDAIMLDKIGFEGYVNINLYTIGLFEELKSTYITTVKTAMDGTNWFAEYSSGETGTNMGLYYKNDHGIASEVGVSFMNDEQYFPMLDDDGKEISWENAGLYNNFKGLKVSDFEFNENTWRYEYVGKDKALVERVLSSANPYDFVPTGFALIIEEGEVMGIYSKSEPDFTISDGYKAISELVVAINYGDTVVVPTINKYNHEAIHDQLGDAIKNMQALNNFTVDFKEITGSAMAQGYVQKGYIEKVTSENRHFEPYNVEFDIYNNENHVPVENGSYGYKKINESLYNSYVEYPDKTFKAVRASNENFDKTRPSFAFAPEIFRSYFVDEEKGTTTYFTDDIMCPVASTFYYGVGNDINIYGIFATKGYTSPTESFNPFVVVKDGYIIESGFYFYLGSMYGVIEIHYSDFNTTTPTEKEIKFETRQVPTSWSQVDIQVSKGLGGTSDDETRNALEYLKEYFADEQIENNLPFFGNVLGDAYGFGLTTVHISQSNNKANKGMVFYYDVPLGVDYTIDAELKKVEDYLIEQGFEKNKYNEFKKGNVIVEPTNSSLDLLIYVWKQA